MNKLLMTNILCLSMLLLGCNASKNDVDSNENAENKKLLEDWSCTAPANLEQIQNYLKDEYLSELNRSIRHSDYQSDLALLDKIQKGIKFEIKAVTTLTQDEKTAKELECAGQLIVHLPKGLQQRAENAFLERPCEECEGDYNNNYTLHDALESEAFKFSHDQLSSNLKYSIIKTDKEGLSLNVANQNLVIEGVVSVSKYAAEYESYVKENKKQKAEIKQYEEKNAEQMALAQKVMDIRHKELEAEKSLVVEQLNQAWDALSSEQRTELKQAQADWFEKRDADCKVIAQKRVYSLSEHEKETYQKHSDYWNEAMREQNERIQYIKCFNTVTRERTAELEGLVE
jgi:uncharacterized protein YecT (DUF1311 family)